MTPDLFHAQRHLAALQKQPQTPEVSAQIMQLQTVILNLEAYEYHPTYSHANANGLVFSGPEYRDTEQTE